MTLLDANYILRWFLGDVPAQSAQAQQLLSTGTPDSLRVHLVTLAEVTYVLRSHGYNHRQIAQVLIELFTYPSVADPDAATRKAVTLYETTPLDFEDCLLAALHAVDGHDIATFDKALQRQLHC